MEGLESYHIILSLIFIWILFFLMPHLISQCKPDIKPDDAADAAIKVWLADAELNKPKDLICPDTGCHRHARSRLAKVSPVNPCEHSIPHRKKGSCGHIKNCPDCIKF